MLMGGACALTAGASCWQTDNKHGKEGVAVEESTPEVLVIAFWN